MLKDIPDPSLLSPKFSRSTTRSLQLNRPPLTPSNLPLHLRQQLRNPKRLRKNTIHARLLRRRNLLASRIGRDCNNRDMTRYYPFLLQFSDLLHTY
jgi:hypothetical protein